jgi:VCBS repeat-containing protein
MTFSGTMATINADLNGLRFIPTPDWAGTGTLQIVTSDLGNTGAGGALGDTDSVSISVVNTPPAGVADGYTVIENNSLAVAAPGVLANDTDPDPQTLSVGTPRPVSGPSHGTLTLNADGSFSYAPAADWSGTDSFTYVVTDGLASSAATAVTITVTDTAYTPSGGWPTAFDGSRYLRVTFPAYVPAGATVTGATLTHTYRSDTAGDTTCYYFEVYQGGSLLATHGSAGSPVSCNGSAVWATDVVPLPEINSVARANAVTVKMFIRNSGTRRSLHRLLTISVAYYLD